MKKIRLLNLLLVVSSLISCHTDVLLEPEFPEYLVLNGDTVRIRKDEGKLYVPYWADKYFIVSDTIVVSNYKKLVKKQIDRKNEDILKQGVEDPDLKNKPLRVIAVGEFNAGGTANNNETMEYSIPSIITSQMGVEFQNPYFEPEDFNGIYTYIPTLLNPTGGPLQKFKSAGNNLAIESFQKDGTPILKRMKPGRVDNFLRFMPDDVWLKRINSEFDNYQQMILNEKFDFLIDITMNDEHVMNKGLEDYIPNRPVTYPGSNDYRSEKLNRFNDIIRRRGVKGILINDEFSAPSLQLDLISVESVRKELEKYQKGRLLDNSAKLIRPTTRIDSLLGPNVNPNLKPYIRNDEKIVSYSSSDYKDNLKIYDKPRRSKLADQLNWAELDMGYIVSQIYLGKYISPDGVSIHYEDLYAEHRLTLNKLFNVIIANEALKSINEYYGTSFSYISTREFLK